MQRSNLPLNPLRAFEAASRHLSFTKAATELFVTNSTVSKHIAKLEALIGTKLFIRRTRNIELTHAGKRLQTSTSRALDDLARSLDEVIEEAQMGAPRNKPYRIRILTGIALKLVVPHISSFDARSDDVELNFCIQSFNPGLNRSDFDFEITYSPDLPYDLNSILFREFAIPVCSPGFMQKSGFKELLNPREMITKRLIAGGEDLWDWKLWANWVGAKLPEKPNTLTVETDDMAIQAAVSGAGISLQDIRLISSELASGVLVPVCQCGGMEIGYYLAAAMNHNRLEVAENVISWLREIAEAAYLNAIATLNPENTTID